MAQPLPALAQRLCPGSGLAQRLARGLRGVDAGFFNRLANRLTAPAGGAGRDDRQAGGSPRQLAARHRSSHARALSAG